MKVINEFFKGLKFYYVGGCVRDLIMGNEPKDYDLITPALPDEIEEYIKSQGRRVWKQGKRFGTLGVKLNGQIVEITTYRTEDYEEGNRKPQVQFTKYLTEDLQRRDFTINALVCDQKGKVRDYFNGLEDIKNGIIRAVGIPKKRFKEDPLRILRGIRFASKYGFNIEEKTLKKLINSRWRLLDISKERIYDEITKIMRSDGTYDLFKYKIFQVIIPQLHLQKDYEQYNPNHDFNLDIHTSLVVSKINIDYDEPKYLWAGLLHDVAKPFVAEWHKSGTRKNYINHDLLGSVMADEICRNLRMSNNDREFIVETITNHINEDSWLKKYDNKSKRLYFR